MAQIDKEGQEILNAIENWAKQFPETIVQVLRSPGSIIKYTREEGGFFSRWNSQTTIIHYSPYAS